MPLDLPVLRIDAWSSRFNNALDCRQRVPIPHVMNSFMLRIYDFLNRLNFWRAILIVVAMFLAFAYCFKLRDQFFGCETPDSLFGFSTFFYTPDDVQAFIDALKIKKGRCFFYAISELTIDVLFPFVYGMQMGLLIVKVWDQRPAMRLLWLPVIAMAADLLENVTLAWQAFAETATALSWFSSSMTFTKFLCLAVAAVFVLLGAVWGSKIQSPVPKQ